MSLFCGGDDVGTSEFQCIHYQFGFEHGNFIEETIEAIALRENVDGKLLIHVFISSLNSALLKLIF